MSFNIQNIMKKALELSRRGGRAVFPNPMVGAVIFDNNGLVVSEGYHQKYGGDHAEIDALRKINFQASRLNMAVTLEPCNHYGKTPPCSVAILNSGIKKIFIAKKEENKNACNGASFLQENGVEVIFLPEFEKEVMEINYFFFKTARTSKPWVTLKAASTLDGFIGEKRDCRTIITGDNSQKEVHKMRAIFMAIGVGANTINCDNPNLGVRLCDGENPTPVIYSKRLNLFPDQKIFEKNPIIFSDEAEKATLFKEKARVEIVSSDNFISESLHILWEKYRLNSILIEGGSSLISSFFESGEVDEFIHFVAPSIFSEGIPISSKRISDFKNNFFLSHVSKIDDSDYFAVYRKIFR